MVKRKVKKKISSVKKKKITKSTKIISNKMKINIALKNLGMFVALFIFSLVLYNVSGQEIYENLFLLLSIIFGFVSIAFLIVLLIFIFLKVIKK